MTTMSAFAELELTVDEECAILSSCIGWSATTCKDRRQELDEYISLYKDQITQIDLLYGLGGEKWPFADRKHQQLLDIVDILRRLGPAMTRNQARRTVKSQLQIINISDHTLDCLIDAAVRIWTLVNFRSTFDISVGRGRPCVEWTDDVEFEQSLNGPFSISTTELTPGQRRLSPHFTIANMVNICGIKVEWASTLDDHLSLDRQHKVLRIFSLRNWLNIKADSAVYSLRNHTQHSSQTGRSTSIAYAPLTKELYEETSRTLDLLFPSWDKGTQRYLNKRKTQDFHSTYSRPRLLDLKYYPYWKDRLLELNEEVFLAPPEGWRQLWRDRRDPQKFWTFWIALLVLWLTMVATAASIIQTWATLKKPG